MISVAATACAAHGNAPAPQSIQNPSSPAVSSAAVLPSSSAPTKPDADRDGLPDGKDACPQEAEDRDGVVDDDGCPEVDADADQFPDTQDRCPTVVGLRLGPRPDGCPTKIPDPLQ